MEPQAVFLHRRDIAVEIRIKIIMSSEITVSKVTVTLQNSISDKYIPDSSKYWKFRVEKYLGILKIQKYCFPSSRI